MESVWSTSAAMPEFPTLEGDAQCDVLIIGGGMAGVLCARYLTDAGINCVLAEERRVGSGITANTTAKISSQHGLCYQTLTKRFGNEAAGAYLRAHEEGIAAFRKLSRGIDCDFQEQSSFVFSRHNRQALVKEMKALEEIGYPAELVERVSLPVENVGAVRFPGQAQFHPLKFLAAISKGLSVYENTPVRELRGKTAVCPQGQISFRKAIIATHFPFLNTHGSFFLKLYQQRSYVLALENAPIPEGMYLEDVKNGLSFRSWDGLTLLGGGGHRTGKRGGGWEALSSFADRKLPGARVIRRWATQDCMSLDGMPYIGHYSALTPELYVSAGFNKWGMTGSMVAAQVLTDLILERENPYARLFSPSRSMLHPQLAVNGWESVSHLLRIGQKRCTHMGCALQWNSAEHSWDCPCHGSRYAADGTRIDNPATANLKKRE